jgi:hypothetical protein
MLHVIGPDGWVSASDLHFARALTASGAWITGPRLSFDGAFSRPTAFLSAVLGAPDAVSVMRMLRTVQVTMLGCGGIGSTVAYLLAGCGVRNFIFVDDDVVVKSNLTRQVLFTKKDIGAPKVQALRAHLRERFDNLSIKAIERRVSLAEQPSYMSDVIVCSADDPPDLARRLSKMLPNHVKLWVGGYLLGVSKVERLNLDKRPSASSSSVDWLDVHRAIAPSIGFQNFEIAARLAASIVVDLYGAPVRSFHFDYRTML